MSRRIEIVGTATLAPLTNQVNGELELKSDLQNAGWNVYECEISYNNFVDSFLLSNYNINIIADVDESYSDQQQIDFVTQLLESKIADFFGTKIFTDIKLQAKNSQGQITGSVGIDHLPSNSISNEISSNSSMVIGIGLAVLLYYLIKK